jgi:aspartate aminotransferase
MNPEQLELTQRVQTIPPSPTVVYREMAQKLLAEGRDVVDLTIGEPDFDTPAHIIEAAHEAMRAGHTHYVDSRGILELRQAIAHKFERDNGLMYDPYKEILVTLGGKQAIYTTIMATIEEGDEVLILNPRWVSYEPMVRAAGGTPVYVPLDAADGFRITEDLLAAHLTDRTRMLILNSPNNPTGKVATREELEAVAAVALRASLLVISDEIYEELVYDGREHVSIASLPGMRDRTIVVNGFSKTYAMTGWRLGYMAASPRILSAVLKLHQHSVTCANAFVQKAGVAALTGPQQFLADMTEQFKARRELVFEGMNAIPGVECPVIEGTFYAFADISSFGRSGEVAERLLQKGGVAIVPGIAFGEEWDTHLRLSFAASRRELEQAIEGMRVALS